MGSEKEDLRPFPRHLGSYLSQHTAGIHQGSSTSPSRLSHIFSLSTPQGECCQDFFKSPSRCSLINLLFIWVYCLPCHFVVPFTQSPRLLKRGSEKENIGQIIIICMFSGTSQDSLGRGWDLPLFVSSEAILNGKTWLEELTLPRATSVHHGEGLRSCSSRMETEQESETGSLVLLASHQAETMEKKQQKA